MSLRVRLVLLIVALVTLVALALSVLHLNSLVNTLSAGALERSELASQQVNTFVIDHINQHAREYTAPADLEETKAVWNQIVASDGDISTMLEKTMALSPALLEINVAGQTGEILASSNPSRLGRMLEPLESFVAWRSLPLYRQVIDLATRRHDYQVTVPLGITSEAPGQSSQPIFTIQVVASSVLLRSALLPQVEALAAVSGGALLICLVLTVLATNRVLRPLKRIERTIDRIVQGNFRGDEPVGTRSGDGATKEFAAVESKLNVLGQQFRGVREDASELKQDLEQLIERMASQLDVASRLAAISRITGGVAHEIKNPLNAIALRLDLLRARLTDPSEELAGEIDILSREVMRLDRVVKTFLDFSRPVDVKFIELDLGALAREVTDLLTPQARVAKIELCSDAPPEPALIRGDPDMLKQAVLNLATNAFEAMPGGGRVYVSVHQNGDAVALEVADNGPGIPPGVRDKVFQLYFTTKTRGSGIGLAMTYRAVQLHNGTIEFESEAGRGTTFRLQFPALVRHA
jgi:signal transduction histidine kinase